MTALIDHLEPDGHSLDPPPPAKWWRHWTGGPGAQPDWLIPAGLVGLSLVPSVAGLVRVVELAGQPGVTAANARFVAAPLPVVVHIASATTFSLVGAFQFSRGFRRQHRQWHRRAGRVLVPAGVVAAATGLWMSVFYDLPARDNTTLMFAGWAINLAVAVGHNHSRSKPSTRTRNTAPQPPSTQVTP